MAGWPASAMPLEELAQGVRLLARLPSFLRRPMTVTDATRTVRRRLEQREACFLRLARRAIYEHSGSPYQALLRLAGCEYGDLEGLVRADGVEGALRTLFRRGVYLTVDEYKGRRPAVRGSSSIPVNPADLRNPCSVPHVPVRSSGSRSQGNPVLLDLAFVRDCAVDACLALAARGGESWQKADWEAPGGGAAFRLLKLSTFGAPPVRWFTPVDPAASGLHPRYRWSARLMRWESLLAGVPLPRPQHVPLDDPLPIARWMAESLQAGETPFLYTFSSLAVRLCEAALGAGIDLSGAQFTLMGEPTTSARLAVIRRTGAEAAPRYGSIESGPIGYACLAPEAADDVHLLHDLHALIQPDVEEADRRPEPRPLFISVLCETAPMVMLNISMGDQAVVRHRPCGCPLERLGWTTHLHTIRSYEKLTGGGVTFLDTDVIRVLEEVLPTRFGGAPTHYQLVEEEAEGSPRLRLLVHPVVGSVDPEAVADTFLEAIGPGSGGERLMGLIWRQSGFFRVERREPLATSTGKILHLHLRRPAY